MEKSLIITGLALVSGCFTPATVATLQGPQQHAQSARLDREEPWRTAVLPMTFSSGLDSETRSGLSDYAGMVLMRTGRFTVVDRTEVDRLLDEQEFSYSGAVDPGTAARLGKMLGAEAVMTANVTSLKHDPFWSDEPAQRDASLHVKIVSVETGEVLYSAAGQGSDFEGAAGALEVALEVALAPLGRP